MSTSIETKLVITDDEGDAMTVTRRAVGEVVSYDFEIDRPNVPVNVSPADANVLFNFLAE